MMEAMSPRGDTGSRAQPHAQTQTQANLPRFARQITGHSPPRRQVTAGSSPAAHGRTNTPLRQRPNQNQRTGESDKTAGTPTMKARDDTDDDDMLFLDWCCCCGRKSQKKKERDKSALLSPTLRKKALHMEGKKGKTYVEYMKRPSPKDALTQIAYAFFILVLGRLWTFWYVLHSLGLCVSGESSLCLCELS